MRHYNPSTNKGKERKKDSLNVGGGGGRGFNCDGWQSPKGGVGHATPDLDSPRELLIHSEGHFRPINFVNDCIHVLYK